MGPPEARGPHRRRACAGGTVAWWGAAPLASIFGSLPDASSLAPRFDTLFNLLLIASAGLVAVLVALNLIFLIRYRRGSPASRAPLRFSEWKLEAGWIAGTLVIFVGFFFGGAWLYLDQERPPRGAYVIDVVGRQWMWDIRHPNGRREFDSLHVPVNTPVRLRLSSEDVIHSFFVPAFRVKQDIVPGRTVSAWFEATRAGSYHLFCTQYCGTEHSGMVGEVVAMAPEDYARWVAAGSAALNVPGRGHQLFVRYGCSGCHADSSPVHAPRLEGVYGSLQPIENRQFIRADAQYLRDSILMPAQHIVAGYQNLMPSFQGTIPENDLLDLIEYLKSIAHETPPPAEAAPASATQP